MVVSLNSDSALFCSAFCPAWAYAPCWAPTGVLSSPPCSRVSVSSVSVVSFSALLLFIASSINLSASKFSFSLSILAWLSRSFIFTSSNFSSTSFFLCSSLKWNSSFSSSTSSFFSVSSFSVSSCCSSPDGSSSVFSSSFLSSSSSGFSPASSDSAISVDVSAAKDSTGDISKVYPRRQDTRPIDSFLVAYLGFLVDPLAFLYSIIFFNLDLLSIFSPCFSFPS